MSFKSLVAAALAVTLTGASSLASAFPVDIEQVRVFKGGTAADWIAGAPGTLFLDDPFTNNVPYIGPQFSTGATAFYSLRGLANPASIANAAFESGGALHLDADYAVVSANANNTASARSLGFRLGTSTSDPNNGLAQSGAFAVAAAFRYFDPLPGYQYGIRLTDGYSNASDIVDLRVVHGGLRMQRQDFVNQAVTDTSQIALSAPLGASFVALALAHEIAGADEVQGYWGFLDASGYLIGNLNAIAQTSHIFHGESFTAFELRAVAPEQVPEPGSVSLMLAGLGLLGIMARRRGVRQVA